MKKGPKNTGFFHQTMSAKSIDGYWPSLKEGEFEAVGDSVTRRANVRMIVASNHDLKGAIRAGRFREELYYRLSVFPIEVPPLRERSPEDDRVARNDPQQS